MIEQHNITLMTSLGKVSQLVPSKYSANVVFGRALRDLDHEAIESTGDASSNIHNYISDGDGCSHSNGSSNHKSNDGGNDRDGDGDGYGNDNTY